MADTVSVQTLTDTTGVKFAVKMTNISDGTGENLVTKVDASNTTFMNATAVSLSGQGFWDLRADGNEITNNATTPTGDVLLSTRNFATGDNYTILVVFR